jgi:hypothetical protein
VRHSELSERELSILILERLIEMSQAQDNLAAAVQSAVTTLEDATAALVAAKSDNGDAGAQAAADTLTAAVKAASDILNPPAPVIEPAA